MVGVVKVMISFNTQPPKGGWFIDLFFSFFALVSTHSRLKAAGVYQYPRGNQMVVSTHSRLKAAGST